MANEERLINANELKANFVVLGEFAKDLWHAGAIRLAIDNAPTVDAVEVVHGRWERICWWQHKNHYEMYKCSICGSQVKPKEARNYCPVCGADMRERKDDG